MTGNCRRRQNQPRLTKRHPQYADGVSPLKPGELGPVLRKPIAPQWYPQLHTCLVFIRRAKLSQSTLFSPNSCIYLTLISTKRRVAFDMPTIHYWFWDVTQGHKVRKTHEGAHWKEGPSWSPPRCSQLSRVRPFQIRMPAEQRGPETAALGPHLALGLFGSIKCYWKHSHTCSVLQCLRLLSS